MDPLVLPRSFQIAVPKPGEQGTCPAAAHRGNGLAAGAGPPPSSYGLLVHQLRLAAEGAEPRGICVGLTSAMVGEGVTTNCVGLAQALTAQTSRSVVLVDADNHHGQGNPAGDPAQMSAPAHIPVLVDQLRRCAYRAPGSDVWLLAAGGCLRRDLPRGWHKAASFVAALQSAYAFSVLDLPAVSEMGAEIELARHADGILLVVEDQRLDRQRLMVARQQLDRWGIRLMGVVLNKYRGYGSQLI